MNKKVLVLLYGKEAWESKTLLSLSKLFKYNQNKEGVIFTIWNNGPKHLSSESILWLDSNIFIYNLVETIENSSLSYIYNKFVADKLYDYYVFFDDDSYVTKGYLDDLLNFDKIGVALPIIYNKGIICSPKLDGEFMSPPFSKNQKIDAIASGMVIHKSIIEVLDHRYDHPFDNAFAFYGVDTSFFFRLAETGLSNQIYLFNGFSHSLSRLQEESNEMKIFRRKERSIDYAIQARKYYRFGFFKIIKMIISIILKRNDMFALTIVKYYILGRHYKSIDK